MWRRQQQQQQQLHKSTPGDRLCFVAVPAAHLLLCTCRRSLQKTRVRTTAESDVPCFCPRACLWVRLWKVCELHATEPLHVWFSENNNEEDLCFLFPSYFVCVVFLIMFHLLKLYLFSAPLQITKCFETFLNVWTYFAAFLVALCLVSSCFLYALICPLWRHVF